MSEHTELTDLTDAHAEVTIAGTEEDTRENRDFNEREHSGEPKEDSIHWPQLIFDVAGTVMTAMLLLLLVMTFFVRQVTVDGKSMNDTLQHEDRLLVSCYDYHPQNGDIVVVTHGRDLDEPIIKRVIAAGGQRLQINYQTGEVAVDGVLLHEPYIIGTTSSVMNSAEIPDVIPEGYVFVMGDNRQNSMDSRSARVDLIPEENIIGKAFFRIYPFESFGTVS